MKAPSHPIPRAHKRASTPVQRARATVIAPFHGSSTTDHVAVSSEIGQPLTTTGAVAEEERNNLKQVFPIHNETGKPLAILKSSKANPGVSLTAISTSFRRERSGWERNVCMMTSRSPRSESIVDSYASWHASGSSSLAR